MEYGTSAWVEVETVRSVIRAYEDGEIELPEVPKDTPKAHIRNVPRTSAERSYTKLTVATFLGWTKSGGKEPNEACTVAFAIIDAVDCGAMTNSLNNANAAGNPGHQMSGCTQGAR